VGDLLLRKCFDNVFTITSISYYWQERKLERNSFTLGDAIGHYILRGEYLSSVPDFTLSERIIHLMNNIVRLDSSGMVQLSIKEQPDMHARLWDTYAETTLRHGSVQYGQNKEDWDRSKNAMIWSSEEVAEKTARLKSHILDESQQALFRFSNYEFMWELLHEGGVFLPSASTFKSQENLSVRDDELQLILTRYLNKAEAAEVMKVFDGPITMKSAKAIQYTVASPDFLVLCLTDAINYRMISDWNAEAAVIIHDVEEFYQRFWNATNKLHTSKLGLERGKLRYIDPFFDNWAKTKEEDLPFCKHYKFAYQREYRFVIRNNQDLSTEDRKIFIGSLSDIATLVDLR
jgi:hypothetical protein